MTSLHTSRDFESELRELRAQTAAMGARCERSVGLALEAFWLGSPQLGADVRLIDTHIDRDEVDIHALALRILATRQPVADDLRFLAAALKLITDLERVGDEAVNIAQRAIANDGDAKWLVRQDLEAMAAKTQDMLHASLEAFFKGDAPSAERVLDCDEAVDAHCRMVIAATIAYMTEKPAEVLPGLRVIRVAKYVERIADHATNVAEKVIFMVRGEDVRHRHLTQL